MSREQFTELKRGFTRFIVVSYGAGTNSTAMVCEMVRRGEPIHAIVFSDTGGERPETYAHISSFDEWLRSRGYPPITVVRNKTAVSGVEVHTLETECLAARRLPGIAYGFGSCSDKWKRRPFMSWLRKTGWTDVTVCFGFDAGERHRSERGDEYNSPYVKRYPLIEWDMGREECVAAIDRAGLQRPGKSACFFCPSSKKHEILALPIDLQRRAIAIESNADLTSIKGLGRSFSWRSLIENADAQLNLDFSNAIDIPCGCFDG